MTDCANHPGTEATHTIGRAAGWKAAPPAEPEKWPYSAQPDVWPDTPLCTVCADALASLNPSAAAELVTEI